MKKQLGQRCQQARRTPRDRWHPRSKKASAVRHPQPAIDVAAHLNDRPIRRRDFPSRKMRRLLRNQRLLRQPRRRQVALQVLRATLPVRRFAAAIAGAAIQVAAAFRSARATPARLIGLVTKSSAPASRQSTSLSSPPWPVSMMVGNCAMAGSSSARSCVSTSAPLRPGMSKSSRRRDGNFRAQHFQRLDSAGRFPAGITGLMQCSRKHASARSVVVDYQDDVLAALHFFSFEKECPRICIYCRKTDWRPSIRCKYSLSPGDRMNYKTRHIVRGNAL